MYQTTETGNVYEQEQEIDLKDLMFAVLYKWRQALLAAAVLAVALGGWKTVTSYRSQSSGGAAQEARDRYERELEVYEKNAANCERELDSLAERLSEQQEYLEESVLMNMSPYSVWESDALLYIKTDYEIMPGMDYQNRDWTDALVQAYQSELTGMPAMSRVSELTGIDGRYLKELVTLTTGNGLLSLRVRSGDEETTEKIMEGLLSGIDEAEERFCDAIGEHTVRVAARSGGKVIDLALLDVQKAQTDQLAELNDRIGEKQTELEGLKKPEEPVVSLTGAVRSGLKYGLLGAALGLFVVALAGCVGFLMSDRVYLGKNLKERYRLPVLGVLPGGTEKKKGVDGLLARLEGRVTEDERGDGWRYDLIAAGLAGVTPEGTRVLVAGTAGEERIRRTSEELTARLRAYEVVEGGNPLKEAETLRELSECGTVVLVESCGVSTYGNVGQELEKAAGLGCKIAGFVVYE